MIVRQVSHLSGELIPVEVLLGKTPIVDGVMLAITPKGTDPTVWRPIDVADDGASGFLLDGTLTVGLYDLYAKVTHGAEIPVLVPILVDAI